MSEFVKNIAMVLLRAGVVGCGSGLVTLNGIIPSLAEAPVGTVAGEGRGFAINPRGCKALRGAPTHPAGGEGALFQVITGCSRSSRVGRMVRSSRFMVFSSHLIGSMVPPKYGPGLRSLHKLKQNMNLARKLVSRFFKAAILLSAAQGAAAQYGAGALRSNQALRAST